MSRKYIEGEIFVPGANQYIDSLLTMLELEFPAGGGDPDNDAVFKNFLLSGQASRILQEVVGPEAVKNVVIQANDTLFSKLQQHYTRNLSIKSVLFSERILVYHRLFFLEIWKTDEEDLEPKGASGIFVQDSSSIPPSSY